MTSAPHDLPRTRRELSRSARDAFPPMGVYAIRDRLGGRVQVKASRNVFAVMNRIRFELRFGCHADRSLQAAWRQGGPDAVGLEVLELVRERDDPAFDYAGELQLLEQLHREELCGGPPA